MTRSTHLTGGRRRRGDNPNRIDIAVLTADEIAEHVRAAVRLELRELVKVWREPVRLDNIQINGLPPECRTPFESGMNAGFGYAANALVDRLDEIGDIR